MERWLRSAFTDGTRYFVSNQHPRKGEHVRIFFRLLEDAPVTDVFLRSKINGIETLIEMHKDYVYKGLQYYAADITPFEEVLRYQIYMVTDSWIYYLTQKGVTQYIPDETYDFRILTDYDQPSWVKRSVFYQIFPDRFFNGNHGNDVQAGAYHFNGNPVVRIDDWNAQPEPYEVSNCLDFYGGDLEGVLQKIPYLKALGITALYLNPIFRAATVHKYDCLDYFAVDPHLGGDEALIALVAALHREGMHIILDISLNHTGTAHRWFNKDGEFFPLSVGAYNNKDALERAFYFFDDDNRYKAWQDVETLPALNYASQTLRELVYRGDHSVIKKWLRQPYNIDGWRLDVANTMARSNESQLHHDVWPEIRRSIKEDNGQAYILAEDWSDCTEFLQGDEWDAPMNYFGCARPLREFAGEPDLLNERNLLLRERRYKQTAHHLAERIRNHFCKLPTVIQENQYNLINSHDISRLQLSEGIDQRHVRGVIVVMFCLPGAPSIYYGDEAGIDGWYGAVEGCRFPMPWSEDMERTESYQLYSTLCHLKTSKPALQDGSFAIVHEEDYVFACARFTADELFVAISSTDAQTRIVRIPLDIYGLQDTQGREVFSNTVCTTEGADAVIIVEPHGSYLFEFTRSP